MSQSRFSRILPLLAAATCGSALLSQNTYAFHSPRALGTSLDVLVTAAHPQSAEAAFATIQSEIARLETMLSTRIPSSYISQLNQSNQPVTVPAELLELLAAYQSAHTLTAGACSPLMGELSARWARAAKENSLPSDSELAAITTRIQETTLLINHANSTVQRIGPALLNIDALGKPFILSKAAYAAWSPSLTGLLVNIGGDILTLGHSSPQTPGWAVGIADPACPAENAAPLATLHMTDAAVVTSGDYARGRTIAGQFVSHILNPLTGQPATHALSATVLHSDPVLANALATYFCVAGPAAVTPVAEKSRAQYLLASPAGVQISSKLPLAADAPAAAWPATYQASVDLKILASPAAPGVRPERANVAIWIESAEGKHVKTIAFWGKDKYTSQLKTWTALGITMPKTMATKAAGTYTVVWDGTDQDNKPVPQGTYTVRVEIAYEKGGHSAAKATIDCAADKSTSTVNKNGTIDASPISYGPKPATP